MSFQLSGSGPELYERVMVPLWFGRWAEALIDLLDLSAGQSVLDVACGTGVTTRLAKARVGAGGRVNGLDVNAPMLATAADLAEDLDIGWLERDAADTGQPDATYDVVLSQHGYHYFPDKPAALSEMRRVLKPGGRLAFSIWDGPSAYTRAVSDAVEVHISPKVAATQRAQRNTPTAADLRAALATAGFRDIDVHRQELVMDVPHPSEFVPLHLGSMPIAAAFEALTPTARAGLIADVETALTAHITGDRMLYPDAVHVAMGRA